MFTLPRVPHQRHQQQRPVQLPVTPAAGGDSSADYTIVAGEAECAGYHFQWGAYLPTDEGARIGAPIILPYVSTSDGERRLRWAEYLAAMGVPTIVAHLPHPSDDRNDDTSEYAAYVLDDLLVRLVAAEVLPNDQDVGIVATADLRPMLAAYEAYRGLPPTVIQARAGEPSTTSASVFRDMIRVEDSWQAEAEVVLMFATSCLPLMPAGRASLALGYSPEVITGM